MKLKFLTLMLLSSFAYTSQIDVPKGLEIKDEYVQMSNQIALFEGQLNLRPIPIAHLESALDSYEGSLEKLLMHKRLSQVEHYIKLTENNKRTLASIKKSKDMTINQRIKLVQAILKGRTQ